MPVPISRRLKCCAAMIPPGARVADVGADHGYLGIYLLQNGLAAHVAACDLREGPLESARRNCARSRVEENMDFYLSDGLRSVPKEAYDTVVCAGMGGDLITKILSEAPWLKSGCYTLILQPQAGINDLRVWLGENGFHEEKADLVRDAGFLYCAMRVKYTGCPGIPTPGQQFLSPALLRSASPLLGDYIARLKNKMNKIILGLTKADSGTDPARLSYYRAALRELEETEKEYGKGQ